MSACFQDSRLWSGGLSQEHFKLLHNGINPRKYIYSEEIRNDVRKNLHLQDKFVLGHVGALKKVKNQIRLIEILNDINDDRYVLLLIGDGEDKDKLVNRVKQLNLEDKVFFLGNMLWLPPPYQSLVQNVRRACWL